VPRPEQTVDIDGRRLKLSNLDKVLYPDAEFTKAQVIDYYARIAPVLVPHLRDRPLTLKRYPNGVDGGFFFEKNCPSHAPQWVAKGPVPSSEGSSKIIDYCMAQDTATIVWLANLAALELHPLLSRWPDVANPTLVVFDLDPGPPADVLTCAQVAVLLREVLDGLGGLRAWPKTSGSKGLQVYVPLNTPHTYNDTKPFAHALAQLLEKRHPELVVSRMDKDLRGGKVFIDWSQNHPTKTTIGVYSLRSVPRPRASTPVTWAEVESAAHADDLAFEADTVLARVAADGDLFAPVLEVEQHLPKQ
jgi:bifunctional non-homologous end joining protein LigD